VSSVHVTSPHRRALLAVALAGALAAGGAVAAPSDGAGDDDRHVLRLLAREAQAQFLDLGSAGLSLGDQQAFSNDLLRGDARVGRDGATCTVVRVDGGAPTFGCVGTNELPGGQITVQGLYAPGPRPAPFTLAVTGGTGRYAGVGGSVRVRPLSETESALTFELRR
jgi:hypothetical protein